MLTLDPRYRLAVALVVLAGALLALFSIVRFERDLARYECVASSSPALAEACR